MSILEPSTKEKYLRAWWALTSLALCAVIAGTRDDISDWLSEGSVKIKITDNNYSDLDWVIWVNDSQTISVWANSEFQIIITNTWDRVLKNIIIKSMQSPECDRKFPELRINVPIEYTCSSWKVESAFHPTITVFATWEKDKAEVNNEDSTEVIVIEK